MSKGLLPATNEQQHKQEEELSGRLCRVLLALVLVCNILLPVCSKASGYIERTF